MLSSILSLDKVRQTCYRAFHLHILHLERFIAKTVLNFNRRLGRSYKPFAYIASTHQTREKTIKEGNRANFVYCG